MTNQHLLNTLAQVRRLHGLVLEKRFFRGYSGITRAAGGVAALTGACLLDLTHPTPPARVQLAVWCMVLVIGLLLNYGALLNWFFFDPRVRRDWRQLLPALDAVPPLAVGALLSVALSLNHHYEYLFSIWMLMYGLAHVSSRQSLPMANYAVGLYYLLAGSICLFLPAVSFYNPWPMGLIFCVGEIAGGLVFHPLHQRLPELRHYDTDEHQSV